MASIILYYSRSGQNYGNGRIQNLKTGNTKIVAEKISQLTQSDLFEIVPVQPYSHLYDECIEQAKEDQFRHARPAIVHYPKIDDYTILYVGFPIYWQTMPMCLFTLLENLDTKGKIICPFCTHEGSGFSNSLKDIQKLCPESEIRKGLAIMGHQVMNEKEAIETWVEEVNYENR